MSEYHSLYIRVKISEEKLQQFFNARPVAQSTDENWLTWWNSHEMYSKQPLEQIPQYHTQNNRAVFDQLVNDRNFGSVEHYDTASQSWTFISAFFSENYIEILPMLALLKHLATYQHPEETGVALIYYFLWGDDEVMAYLEFANGQAMLKPYTKTQEIDAAILGEANKAIEAAVETYNKQFED
ncbi:hypothetical protein [Empedobacter brevis]|uniref:hypothetical protein n=1 Tax=Empedobacter brevis TaxID=247 RepID=UPI00289EA673|nr:hypothetical protein [Empedobacter brevis]